MTFFIKMIIIGLFLLPSSSWGAEFDHDHLLRRSETPRREASIVPSPDGEGASLKRKREEDGEEKHITWGDLPGAAGEGERPKKRPRLELAADIFFAERERNFSTELDFVQHQLREACEQADSFLIRGTYKHLTGLEYPEGKWRSYARKLKAYKWPSQETWKDVVAGHLFFPREAFDWANTPCLNYLLDRRDNLWRFSVAAKFHHPVARYFAIWRALELWNPYNYGCGRPVIFDEQFRIAFEDLKQCEDNPDACYVIGWNYALSGWSSKFVGKQGIWDLKELDWHKKGGDLKNQFRILCRKKSVSTVFDPPTLEEWLSLGRAGYGPAYIKALGEVGSDEERKAILEEAVAGGYTPALFNLAVYYKREGQEEKRLECYLRAAEAGVVQGYLNLGRLKVGKVSEPYLTHKKDLTEVIPEDIEETKAWFRRAGEAHHPEGWDSLATLYFELQKIGLMDDDVWGGEFYPCIHSGMALGSEKAYTFAYNFYTEKGLKKQIQKYGGLPRDFIYELTRFLKTKP